MALVIYNCKYYSPEDKFSLSAVRSALYYISLREGARLISDDDNRQMSQGITAADRSGLDYISDRRGAEQYDDEPGALFNAFGKANVEEQEALREVYSDSYEWRAVISLTKEDAERVGYTTPYDYQQLCTRVMPQVAAEYGISPDNLIWNAAYHPVDKDGDDHHPHIHVHFYSKDPSEGVNSKADTAQILEKARSIFTNDIFQDELRAVSADRTAARDKLSKEIAEALNTPSNDIMGELYELSNILPTKGRLSYGYMPQKTKLKVDKIVHKIISVPKIKELYINYYTQQLRQVMAYNDDEDKIKAKMDKFEKSFYHPTGQNDKATIHNAVLKSAKNIRGYIAEQQKNLSSDFFVRLAAGLNAPYDIDRAGGLLKEVIASDARFSGMSREEIRKTVYKSMLMNLRAETDKVYGILKADGDFRQRLTDEVRFDAMYDTKLNLSNNPTDEFAPGQFDVLSDATQGDLMYYVRAAVDKYESVSEKALEAIIAQYTDYGLRYKARSLIRENIDKSAFDDLRSVVECKMHKIDSMNQQQYKNIMPQISPVAKMFCDINAETSGISDTKIMTLVLDELMRSAYYLNLEQCFSENLKPNISDELKKNILEFADVTTEYRRCDEVQQAVCAEFISSCCNAEIDRRGIEYLSDRIIRYVVIDNAVSTAPPGKELSDYIGLNSEYNREDKQLDALLDKCIADNPMLKDIPNTAVAYTKNVIYFKCRAENLKNEMKEAGEYIRTNRDIFKNLAEKISLSDEFDQYPDCAELAALRATLPADKQAAECIKAIYSDAVSQQRIFSMLISDSEKRQALLNESAELRQAIRVSDIKSPDDLTPENQAKLDKLTDDICSDRELQEYKESNPQEAARGVFRAVHFADYIQSQAQQVHYNAFAALISLTAPISRIFSEPKKSDNGYFTPKRRRGPKTQAQSDRQEEAESIQI